MQSPPFPRYLVLLGPNILNTMFSNTLNFLSSLNVSDQVLHPYKTTGKIIILYILIFKFLDSNLEDCLPIHKHIIYYTYSVFLIFHRIFLICSHICWSQHPINSNLNPNARRHGKISCRPQRPYCLFNTSRRTSSSPGTRMILISY